MALPPLKKKRPPAFEDIPDIEEEPMTDEFEEDYSEEDPLALDEEMPMDDPLVAEGDMGMGLDPEQAALAEQLGFTEPDQQQALIDLIKLVATPPAPSPMEGF